MVRFTRFLLAGLTVIAISLGAGGTALADEYDDYGYQFSPGYYDAYRQDPTNGGQQGEVGSTQEPPPPTAPNEGSPVYNYNTGEDTYQYTYGC